MKSFNVAERKTRLMESVMFFQKPLHSVQTSWRTVAVCLTRSRPLSELQRCLRAEGELFLQDSAETELCYTLIERMVTCNCARVRPTCWRSYGKFTATSISWPLCSFHAAAGTLQSKVTSSECISACICARFSGSFWSLSVLTKMP